jgi:hypothetical protein
VLQCDSGAAIAQRAEERGFAAGANQINIKVDFGYRNHEGLLRHFLVGGMDAGHMSTPAGVAKAATGRRSRRWRRTDGGGRKQKLKAENLTPVE